MASILEGRVVDGSWASCGSLKLVLVEVSSPLILIMAIINDKLWCVHLVPDRSRVPWGKAKSRLWYQSRERVGTFHCIYLFPEPVTGWALRGQLNKSSRLRNRYVGPSGGTHSSPFPIIHRLIPQTWLPGPVPTPAWPLWPALAPHLGSLDPQLLSRECSGWLWSPHSC